ncbi:MAG: HslU--HslV peptidase ATPase subunit [Planctomycetia bacterium]|nr:HslU--HslV peptidase ATPase subunit [Planctomycetia bacterium]
MFELTPKQIVAELDKHIVGQDNAKRAVAVAVRNRWRRQQVGDEIKKEIGPKNLMMIGPTGVGKTEIARRLAKLTGAPFIKVEATKYTEVGYYGRDVESMVRELVENAISIVRQQEREKHEAQAKEYSLTAVSSIIKECREKDLLAKEAGTNREPKTSDVNATKDSSDDRMQNVPDLGALFSAIGIPQDKIPKDVTEIVFNVFSAGNSENKSSSEPAPDSDPDAGLFKDQDDDAGCLSGRIEQGVPDSSTDSELLKEIRQRPELQIKQIYRDLSEGKLDNEVIRIFVKESKQLPFVVSNAVGGDGDDSDMQSMLENLIPKQKVQRKVTVAEARKIKYEEYFERTLNPGQVNSQAIELAENMGIIFIDEIDKIVASERQTGADVSRQGVQRDLLPIVEGTTVRTKYGLVSTEHVLFVGAGAFHRVKPTDLMPELQGRFPIRVELTELNCDDFVRILTEPRGALTKQYIALMKTEGVNVSFTEDAVNAIAHYAFEVNQTTQNIGARRLYTIMERLLEELSFEAPEMKMGNVVINAAYVSERLETVVADDDMSRFIL